jgi:hypothetical protein
MSINSKMVASAAPKAKPPNAGKGRVKGVPNKSTAAVKQALIEAFDELGGVPSLVAWAKKQPTEFYKLWAKMMPLEVSGPNGGPIQLEAVVGIIEKLTPEERVTLRELAEKLEGAGA